MKTKEYYNLFQELKHFSPSKITLTGGEPLLRNDLKKIVEYLKRSFQNPLLLSLNTNGSKVNTKNVKWLVESFDEISVSIDGFRSFNDTMRGSGTFDQALNAIRNIVNAGGTTSVSITRTSINDAQIEGFIAYLRHEWGIHSFRINDVKIIGRAKNSPWLSIGDYFCDNSRENKTILNNSCFIGEKCFEKTLNVLPNGDCYPCHYLQLERYFLGNIKKTTLLDIIAKLDEIKKTFSQERICLP